MDLGGPTREKKGVGESIVVDGFSAELNSFFTNNFDLSTFKNVVMVRKAVSAHISHCFLGGNHDDTHIPLPAQNIR